MGTPTVACLRDERLPSRQPLLNGAPILHPRFTKSAAQVSRLIPCRNARAVGDRHGDGGNHPEIAHDQAPRQQYERGRELHWVRNERIRASRHKLAWRVERNWRAATACHELLNRTESDDSRECDDLYQDAVPPC